MVAEKRTRKQINARNRRAGKALERTVAKLLDGSVVPMSGAIKNSVHNLTGDVTVRNYSGAKELLKVECKLTSKVTPKGDRSFTLKKSVLDQAAREAAEAGSLGALWIHWNALSHDNDYIVMTKPHFQELVELARLGSEVEDKGFDN